MSTATLRFCPQCQRSLPANAPEGLCSQCLMKAATAPPSEPQMVTTGSGIVDIGDPVAVGKCLPQFEIIELLGRGGMGVVYKARQLNLDRTVALKILPPSDSQPADFVERFRREARSLAKLNHPNIVNVHDFGESGGLYYFVMEFVDGVNLREMIRTGKMKPEEALAVVPKICDALQFAHEEGVVHRDVKPENILIDKRGRVKIADFGLAKLLRRDHTDHTLTMSGMTLGTPRYMAPEQLDKPDTVDHRADIYSLGVVFYEMLTGEVPMGRFAPPSEKVRIDVRLDEIVLHALERDADRRYQHVSQVRDDVEEVTSKPKVAQASPPVGQAAVPAAAAGGTPGGPTDWKSAPQPPATIRFVRAMLWLAAVVGVVMFCWFEKITYFANPTLSRTQLRIGAVQPWLVLGEDMMGRGHYAPNFLTVSGLAGIGALIAGIALLCFRRPKVPKAAGPIRIGDLPEGMRRKTQKKLLTVFSIGVLLVLPVIGVIVSFWPMPVREEFEFNSEPLSRAYKNVQFSGEFHGSKSLAGAIRYERPISMPLSLSVTLTDGSTRGMTVNLPDLRTRFQNGVTTTLDQNELLRWMREQAGLNTEDTTRQKEAGEIMALLQRYTILPPATLREFALAWPGELPGFTPISTNQRGLGMPRFSIGEFWTIAGVCLAAAAIYLVIALRIKRAALQRGREMLAVSQSEDIASGPPLLAQINARGIEMMIAGTAIALSGFVAFVYGMGMVIHYVSTVTNPNDNAVARAASGAFAMVVLAFCGIAIQAGGVTIRKLRFHGYALAMSILLVALLPAMRVVVRGREREWIFFQLAYGLYAGIRAFRLLRKPEVEAVFAAAAPAPGPKSSSEPRLSRLALRGAICMAALAIGILIFYLVNPAAFRKGGPQTMTETGALRAGTLVAAKWDNNPLKLGLFFIATINRMEDNGGYFVFYGDGDSGTVAARDILLVNPTQPIPIGTHVLACWRGAMMYPGVVTARREYLYTVKWDDGDTPLEVPRERIAPLGESASAISSAYRSLPQPKTKP